MLGIANMIPDREGRPSAHQESPPPLVLLWTVRRPRCTKPFLGDRWGSVMRRRGFSNFDLCMSIPKQPVMCGHLERYSHSLDIPYGKLTFLRSPSHPTLFSTLSWGSPRYICKVQTQTTQYYPALLSYTSTGQSRNIKLRLIRSMSTL